MIWSLILGLVFAEEKIQAGILTYQLGAGDSVTLEVIGEPDMSRTIRIASDGSLEIPLAGRVLIEGMTLDQAMETIRSYLANGYLVSPQVVLSIEEFASKRVDVSGGVTNPATYFIDSGHMTVSQMLLRAGGLKDPSAPEAIVRRGGTELHVNLEQINRGDTSADIEVQPGDQLYVPPVEKVYVNGQVQNPGAISYQEGMKAWQAVIMAGGPLSAARLKGAYIVRGEEKIHVNFKRISRGEAPDIELRPNDTIQIPESAL